MSNSIRDNVLIGLIIGLMAGVVFGLFIPSSIGFLLDLVVAMILGIIFGLVFGPRIRTTGAGLVWGEVYGLLWWFIGRLTLIPLLVGQGLSWRFTNVQETFPLLLRQVIGYGIVLGLGYYFLAMGWTHRESSAELKPSGDRSEAKSPTRQAIVTPLIQAVIIGGLGGLLGSWVFLRGIETAEFFPLVAELMGSTSAAMGGVLHYLIGTIIGVSFSLLFYRDIQGTGSSLVWGLNYGLVWWVIGSLTLMPILPDFKAWPDWTLAAARAAFPALMAHLLYGAIVGLFYALLNKLWQFLFVASDPLNRSLEGPGARGLRSILMGQAGGVTGGLLFTIVMVGGGMLPQVASLVGAESALAGFVVHLIIAVIIGSSYGLLFQRAAYSYGAGLAWGMVYGLLWWLVGAVTLFPIFLGQPVDWSLSTVVDLYPSLVGHLLYGAGLGLFFQFLARRYDHTLLISQPRPGPRGVHRIYLANPPGRQRAANTPAPALWAVVLILGVILPLLLA